MARNPHGRSAGDARKSSGPTQPSKTKRVSAQPQERTALSDSDRTSQTRDREDTTLSDEDERHDTDSRNGVKRARVNEQGDGRHIVAAVKSRTSAIAGGHALLPRHPDQYVSARLYAPRAINL
jgi:hypothetical protein